MSNGEHDHIGGVFLLVLLLIMLVLGATVPMALFRIARAVEHCAGMK